MHRKMYRTMAVNVNAFAEDGAKKFIFGKEHFGINMLSDFI